MKKVTTFVRIGFGIVLSGIGVLNLTGVMPPMQYPEPANSFMAALLDTKYVMFIVSMLKVIVGLSMLTKRFVPLALLVFFPITVNMILFHAFLDFKGITPALVIGVLHVYLLFGYRNAYSSLLKPEHIKAKGDLGARKLYEEA